MIPAYGRDLLALRRAGKTVSWLVLALDWDHGRPLPRLVIPDSMPLGQLDLSMVEGIPCMVSHDGEIGRALSVAELALRSGASMACVFDHAAARLDYTTAEVMAIRGAHERR